MTITIDKTYTRNLFDGSSTEALKNVRKAIKEFKGRYTERDIISMKIEAFGSEFSTSFCIEAFVNGLISLYRIRFYCDLDLTVDTSDLYTIIEEYTRVF